MHPEIRKRAVLFVSEAVFGNRLPTENVRPLEKADAFPDGKPSSIIVSRSPFFHDLVILNYINYEMTGNVHILPADSHDGWLRNCVGAVPSFTGDVIGSASLVRTPASSRLPATDLSYPPERLNFISIAS